MACKTEEAIIHNWQQTEWAEGMIEPVPVVETSPGKRGLCRARHRSTSRDHVRQHFAFCGALAARLSWSSEAVRNQLSVIGLDQERQLNVPLEPP
jgi:hypothetical protein